MKSRKTVQNKAAHPRRSGRGKTVAGVTLFLGLALAFFGSEKKDRELRDLQPSTQDMLVDLPRNRSGPIEGDSHPEIANVVMGADLDWRPAAGYIWVNAERTSVIWTPHLKHPSQDLASTEIERQWRALSAEELRLNTIEGEETWKVLAFGANGHLAEGLISVSASEQSRLVRLYYEGPFAGGEIDHFVYGTRSHWFVAKMTNGEIRDVWADIGINTALAMELSDTVIVIDNANVATLDQHPLSNEHQRQRYRLLHSPSNNPVDTYFVGFEGSAIDAPAGITGRVIEISKVFEGTPAERAGLLPGDVIYELEGLRVGSPYKFSTALLTTGTAPVTVGFLRDGQQREISVTPVRRAVQID